MEELRQCLQQLSDGSAEADPSLIGVVARQLHMLKGDAKLLGFDAIHAAAEHLEDHILPVESGAPNGKLNGLLHHLIDGVDTLERLVQAGEVADDDDLGEAPGGAAEASVTRHGVRADGQPWRILLIDDSEIAIEVQRARLHEAGFEVRATTSLGTFDELLEDWCPQVILADVDMPTLSGPELCRTLKGRYDTAHVPIVLCSALSTDRLRQLARDCEAEGYVSKARLETLAEDLGELCEAMAW